MAVENVKDKPISRAKGSWLSTVLEEDFKKGGLENNCFKFSNLLVWTAWFAFWSAFPALKFLAILTKMPDAPYSKINWITSLEKKNNGRELQAWKS